MVAKRICNADLVLSEFTACLESVVGLQRAQAEALAKPFILALRQRFGAEEVRLPAWRSERVAKVAEQLRRGEPVEEVAAKAGITVKRAMAIRRGMADNALFTGRRAAHR